MLTMVHEEYPEVVARQIFAFPIMALIQILSTDINQMFSICSLGPQECIPTIP